MINKMLFEGRVGQDPVLKFTTGAKTPYCDVTVCQTVKSGNKETEQWVEVRAWGKQAESYVKNLHSGRRVLIDGKNFYNDKWTDRDGKPRTTAKCEAVEIGYLDLPTRRGDGTTSSSTAAAPTNAAASRGEFDEDNPDLLDIDNASTPFGGYPAA